MVIAGLVIALVGLLALVASAARIVRRALPAEERLGFQQAGNESRWTALGIAALPDPIGSFAREVLDCSSESERVDLICERLASVDLDTARIDQRLNMFARCALAIAAVTFVGVATCCLRHPTPALLLSGAVPSVFGVISALYCWSVGQKTKAAVAQRRRNWDYLTQLLLHSTNSGRDPNRTRPRLYHAPAGALSGTRAARKHRSMIDAYNAILAVG